LIAPPAIGPSAFFFRRRVNAKLIAETVFLLFHRAVDRPLDKGKHQLIDPGFLGWVADLDLSK